jgi:protein phosphatase
VVHHPAFGFALVRAVHVDRVELEWERPSRHLPTEATTDGIVRAYTLCQPDGFFARAVTHPEPTREQLLQHPAEALASLLEELEGPQRIRDVMDWCVGRALFTPKTFVRWWGTTEAVLRADARLIVEGEWVRRSDVALEPMQINQLEPGLVQADSDEGFTLHADAADVDELPRLTRLLEAHEVAGESTALLVELPMDARAFLDVGLALAQAMVDDPHATPLPSNTRLHPDGTITLDGEDTASADAVADRMQAATAVLLQAFLGRALPPGASPSDLLPFLRHRMEDLPAAACAPLVAALQPDPALRPPHPSAWRAIWQAALDAERERAAAAHGDAYTATLQVGYDSHIGRVKLLQSQVNQDCLYVARRSQQRLCVLCDGISVADAGRGEIASRLVTAALGRLWENVNDLHISSRRLLDRALHLANRTVCERALRIAGGDLRGRMPMGTTIVAALCHGAHVDIVWLGDSRAYLAGPWGVSQLTGDDNVAGERLHAWCDGYARSWTNTGHALVRYVGHFDTAWEPAALPAHHLQVTLLPGERLLLCSDGITDYIDPHEAGVARRIAECLANPDPDDAARALVSLANKAGGGDNASAIVLSRSA